MFWPFTVWKNCSSDLKFFSNFRPSASNFKSFSRSLELFFLTVGQNNFGNKIPFLAFLFEIYLKVIFYLTMTSSGIRLPTKASDCKDEVSGLITIFEGRGRGSCWSWTVREAVGTARGLATISLSYNEFITCFHEFWIYETWFFSHESCCLLWSVLNGFSFKNQNTAKEKEARCIVDTLLFTSLGQIKANDKFNEKKNQVS